ncbi:MAG: PD-(D/E)XK nuclease family protein [Marinilabiliaceae bacterium]
MILHFSPAFDEGVYPLPESRNLLPGERYVGCMGLLMLLERELGFSAEYAGNEERALLYKKALEGVLDLQDGVFFYNSFKQDALGVAEKLLAWRDELVMSGFKNTGEPEALPERLRVLWDVEKLFEQNGFESYGTADRWQDVLMALPEAEISVEKIVVHEQRTLLHPFFVPLLNVLSEKTDVEESLFDVEPIGESNLQRLQRALLKEEKDVTLNPLDRDESLVILKVKDNYVAGDFIADQIQNGYDALFFNDDNVAFDNSLISAGLAASGSVNVDSAPQILQLFKLISTGLFAPVNVKNLLSLLQAPYLPFSHYLASRLAEQLTEMPGINNEKWNEIVDGFIEGDHSEKRKADLETFLTFNETETNVAGIIRKRYWALKQWVDQYPHLEMNEVKEEEKEQFIYLGRLCSNLLTELGRFSDEEEISERQFSQMLEGIYKPGTFCYFQKQKGSPTVFQSPGVVTQQAPRVCWMNWQNGRQRGVPLDFLSREELAHLSKTGALLYARENLDRFRFFTLLKGILAASDQLVLMIPEVTNGEVSVPHALAGDIDAAVRNIEVVSLDSARMQEWKKFFTKKAREHSVEAVDLPRPVNYLESVDAIGKDNKPNHESPSSIEKLIQHPLDYVVEHLANIRGTGIVALPDLFRQKGLVTHGAVEQIVNELKEDPDAVFSDGKVSRILAQNIDRTGLEFRLPENRFELHEMEEQFRKSVRVLLEIIRENKLKVDDAEVFKSDAIGGIGPVVGYIDLLLTDDGGNPVVIDLKWTFKSRKYASKIEEEKDLQLIIYRELMRLETQKAIKTGYFLLNDGKFYTRYDFKGQGVVVLEPQSTEDEMLQRVVESVKFRRNELAEGRIEVGEEMPVTNLRYHNEADEKGLMPLETDSSKKNKRSNYYSNLSLFRGGVK